MTLAAGAALTVAGCGASKKTSDDAAAQAGTEAPPGDGQATAGVDPDATPVPVVPDAPGGVAPSKPEPMPPTANPPPPERPHSEPMGSGRERIALIEPGLPSFAEVKSPHPEGATNPPSPVLLVTPDGRCFVTWEGGMMPPGPDRVVKSAKDMGATHINCPVERAQKVWDTWDTGGRVFRDK
jgi:hypothetical protein